MMHHPLFPNGAAGAVAEFLVVCLCAEWCGVCREYRSVFQETTGQFPAASFHWLDIEVHADDLGNLEVENFPTLLIKRQEWVLFYASMPPSPGHLQRILRTFLLQSVEESRAYAYAREERRCWQDNEDLQRLDPDQLARICG